MANSIIDIPNDILCEVYFKLDILDLLSYSNTNKANYNSINDKIYWLWGTNKYSHEFWQRAFSRNIFVSNPLYCMKKELIRIHIFQNNIKNMGLPEWTNQDFYTYWESTEKNYINSSSINNALKVL